MLADKEAYAAGHLHFIKGLTLVVALGYGGDGAKASLVLP